MFYYFFRFLKEVLSIVMVSGTWYLNTLKNTGVFYKITSHSNKTANGNPEESLPWVLDCVLKFNAGSEISHTLSVVIFLLFSVLRMLGLSIY